MNQTTWKLSMFLLLRISTTAFGLNDLATQAETQHRLQTLLVGFDRRDSISLNGAWHYLVDPPPAQGLYAARHHACAVLSAWLRILPEHG